MSPKKSAKKIEPKKDFIQLKRNGAPVYGQRLTGKTMVPNLRGLIL